MANYLLLIISVLFAWYIFPSIIRFAGENRLRTKCRRNQVLVLTYDDGPSPSFTQQILDLLEQHDVKATFFMQGIKIEPNPGFVRQIINNGHEVGSHSYRHLNAWKSAPWKVFRDVSNGIEQIKIFNGSMFFRPPFGKITLATMLQVLLNDVRFGWWTIDSSDTWPATADVMSIVQQVKEQGGGVVLIHDHERPEHPERHDFVLKITSSLIEMARLEGLKVCTMQELHQMP